MNESTQRVCRLRSRIIATLALCLGRLRYFGCNCSRNVSISCIFLYNHHWLRQIWDVFNIPCLEIPCFFQYNPITLLNFKYYFFYKGFKMVLVQTPIVHQKHLFLLCCYKTSFWKASTKSTFHSITIILMPGVIFQHKD